MFDRLAPHAPRALSVLRIVAALLFIAHGTQKLFNWPPIDMDFGGGLMTVAGILETFGGLLILVGFLTRPVAFVLCGMMAVAYFMAHAPQSLYPVLNGGDTAILFCFVFGYLVFAGPGPWSVDARR